MSIRLAGRTSSAQLLQIKDIWAMSKHKTSIERADEEMRTDLDIDDTQHFEGGDISSRGIKGESVIVKNGNNFV